MTTGYGVHGLTQHQAKGLARLLNALGILAVAVRTNEGAAPEKWATVVDRSKELWIGDLPEPDYLLELAADAFREFPS